MSAWDDATHRDRQEFANEILSTPVIKPPSHRDGLECIEEIWEDPATLDRTLGMSIRLCSLSPADMDWFDEHAPGWQEHISVIVFETKEIVSHHELTTVKRAREALAHKLAHTIVERTEPMIERSGDGVEVHGC